MDSWSPAERVDGQSMRNFVLRVHTLGTAQFKAADSFLQAWCNASRFCCSSAALACNKAKACTCLCRTFLGKLMVIRCGWAPSDCQYVSSRSSLSSSTPLPALALVTLQTACPPTSRVCSRPLKSATSCSAQLLTSHLAGCRRLPGSLERHVLQARSLCILLKIFLKSTACSLPPDILAAQSADPCVMHLQHPQAALDGDLLDRYDILRCIDGSCWLLTAKVVSSPKQPLRQAGCHSG